MLISQMNNDLTMIIGMRAVSDAQLFCLVAFNFLSRDSPAILIRIFVCLELPSVDEIVDTVTTGIQNKSGFTNI